MSTALNEVNEHCVDRIFDLANTKPIIASEDIYDANGTKLWAKGHEISAQLKERLAQRRLRTPLELSLEIEGSITTGIIVDDCLQAIDNSPVLPRIAGSQLARATLSRLRMVKLPGAIRLLLSVTQNGLDKSYQNALYTLAISAGFAAQHNFADRELEMLLVAALLHDLGEIYIDPDYVNSGRVITPAEWASMASHPMVGHAVARDIGKLPEAVTKGIAQHHERLDGSGYPAMLTKAEMSPLGRIVATADAVAAILLRAEESAAYQTTLALKIVPEEFDRQCVNFIADAIKALAVDKTPGARRTCGTCRVRPTVERLRASAALIQQLIAEAPGGAVQSALHMAHSICLNVEKALRSTGVEQLLLDKAFGDGISCAEACDVEREIHWRLRHLARNLHLRVANCGTAETAPLQPLFALLEGTEEAVAA